jgi:hypothetical protein
LFHEVLANVDEFVEKRISELTEDIWRMKERFDRGEALL